MTNKKAILIDDENKGIEKIQEFAVMLEKSGVKKVSIGRTGKNPVADRLKEKRIANPVAGENFFYFKCVDKAYKGDAGLAIDIENAAHCISPEYLSNLVVVNKKRLKAEEKKFGTDRTVFVYMHAV